MFLSVFYLLLKVLNGHYHMIHTNTLKSQICLLRATVTPEGAQEHVDPALAYINQAMVAKLHEL